jgi:4-amino-4-deoxy-L-arabinose transferase-like glycosyltransferase
MKRIDVILVALLVSLFCLMELRLAQSPFDAFHVDSLHYLSVSLVMRNLLQSGDLMGLANMVAGEILPNPPLVEVTTALTLLVLRPSTLEGCRIAATASIFPYMFLLAFSLYFLTRDLCGRAAGVVAVLTCLSAPGTMTAGRYCLMDIPAAALFITLLYGLVKCDLFRSRTYSLLSGAALGLGMMVKTSFAIYAAGPVAVILARAWYRFPRDWAERAVVALFVIACVLGARMILQAVPPSSALEATSHPVFFALSAALLAAFIVWAVLARRCRESPFPDAPFGRGSKIANLVGAALLFFLICVPLYADNLPVLKTIMSHSHEAGTVMKPPPLRESPYPGIFVKAFSPLAAGFACVGLLTSLAVPGFFLKSALLLAAFPIATANLLSFTYIDMRYLLPLFPVCAVLAVSWPGVLKKPGLPFLLVLAVWSALQMAAFDLSYRHRLDGPAPLRVILEKYGLVRKDFSFYNAWHGREIEKVQVDGLAKEVFETLTDLSKGERITLVSCFEARSVLSYGMMRSYAEFHRLPVRFIDIGHGRGSYPPVMDLQYGVFVVGNDPFAYANRLVDGLSQTPAKIINLPDDRKVVIYAFKTPVKFKILEYTRNPGG